MGLTVADCLKLPALRDAELVAGARGLDNIVASVSVLEWAEVSALTQGLFLGNEVVITAFHSVRNDVDAQCRILRRLQEVGEVGLILYYVGLVMPEISPALIKTADELDFPLIVMPRHIYVHRYSEAICEIMEAIFRDKILREQFSGDMIHRISRLPPRQRSVGTVLRMLSDRLQCSLLLSDKEFRIIDFATWPMAFDLNAQEIMDQYKNEKTSQLEGDGVAIHYGGKAYATNLRPVAGEKQPALNLVFIRKDREISADDMEQSVEVLRLSNSIWGLDAREDRLGEFVGAVLGDEPLRIQRLANVLSLDMSTLRGMWLFKNPDAEVQASALAIRNGRLLVELKRFFQAENVRCIVDLFDGEPIAFIGARGELGDESSLAQRFMDIVKKEGAQTQLVHYVNLGSGQEFRQAYAEIKTNYVHAAKIYPRAFVFSMNEIKLAALCNDIAARGEGAVNAALEPIKALTGGHEGDQEGRMQELRSTLKTYLLDAGMNIDQTSRLLYVHRNTVKYRIRRIEESLGYDFRPLPGSYILYIAAALDRLLEPPAKKN